MKCVGGIWGRVLWGGGGMRWVRGMLGEGCWGCGVKGVGWGRVLGVLVERRASL